ncbi:HTH-type transcriptional regulator AcrR [Burkholderiales bacterium]|nr:HTH-type transcriptional regulator AcrR [Burkholderiales bacterium]
MPPRRTREAASTTREQLLDAAERVFRDRGVTRTSLAEVAAEAGVTRGAVYWHFRDKADLFAAMCERATSPMDALVEQARGPGSETPLATLRSLCIDTLMHLTGDSRAQAVLEIMFHRSELSGELAPVAERRDRDCRHARVCVEAVLLRAVDAGELPRDTDTALAVHAVYAYVTGLMHEWTLDPAAYDLRASAPALVDAFIAGLAGNPPRVAAADASAAARHLSESG